MYDHEFDLDDGDKLPLSTKEVKELKAGHKEIISQLALVERANLQPLTYSNRQPLPDKNIDEQDWKENKDYIINLIQHDPMYVRSRLT